MGLPVTLLTRAIDIYDCLWEINEVGTITSIFTSPRIESYHATNHI